MDGGGDQVSTIDSSCLGMFMIQWEFNNIEKYTGIFFLYIPIVKERLGGREGGIERGICGRVDGGAYGLCIKD